MRLLAWILVFLLINFGGLAIGGLLMNNGPLTDWYINLNQAPWTPPSWVFGFAWTLIMVCFSIYLGYLFLNHQNRELKILFSIQVFLNVIWNYVFFNQHWITLGLVVICLLTILIFFFFFRYTKAKSRTARYLLLPYMVWLGIATSLNAYIVIYN